MKSFYDHLIGHGPMPEHFKPAGTLSLEKAFQVYQRGYVARLTESLGDTYEAVWRVLGDELFFSVAKEFIARTPSRSYDLGDYSEDFISFLKTHPVSEEFPFLSDLARLGWSQYESFQAPMESGLAGNELLQVLSAPSGEAAFVSHVRLLESDFALYDIWNALVSESDPPENWNEPQCLLLYKSENQVHVKFVEKNIFQALKNISAQKPLVESCAHLSEQDVAGVFEFLARSALLKAKI